MREMSSRFEEIKGFLSSAPVVSSHDHHLEDQEHAVLTLDELFRNSYVAWQEIDFSSDPGSRAAFLRQARHNAYFVWLEKALHELYDFDGKITAENWDDLSQQISANHRDPDSHIRILRDNCRYKAGIVDIYWNPGSDAGHPELFKPVVRTDMFAMCYHPSVHDHDGNALWEWHSIQQFSFDEYLEYLEGYLKTAVQRGAVGFKLAVAYERTLHVGEPLYEKAARVFLQNPALVTPAEVMAYGDYIIDTVARIAGELQVPLQVHTGLGQLSGSNPLLLEPLIERHVNTTFVLFHGGFPWYHELGALSHNHRNVVLDMVWLPMISPFAAVQALHEYIEIVPSSDRISWGSDCWTSEEALGSVRAWEYVLAKVLSDKVESGYFDIEEARTVGAKLMSGNAISLYGLAGF